MRLELSDAEAEDLAAVLEDALDELREASAAYDGKAPPELRRIAATVGRLRDLLARGRAARNDPPTKSRRRPKRKGASKTDRLSGPAEIDVEAFMRP